AAGADEPAIVAEPAQADALLDGEEVLEDRIHGAPSSRLAGEAVELRNQPRNSVELRVRCLIVAGERSPRQVPHRFRTSPAAAGGDALIAWCSVPANGTQGPGKRRRSRQRRQRRTPGDARPR